MMQNFLYAKLSGWTATFKMPLFFSNTGVKSVMPTLKIPPYSTIIGMLGNMVGRDLMPNEINKIGFIFEYKNKDNSDLEKLESYKIDKEKGKLIRNIGISNPTRREFLVRPTIHLYLENIDLFEPYFYEPFNIPTFGRSQDVAWMETLENGKQYQIIDAEEVKEGKVRNTIVPFPQPDASGIILPMADYYDNFTIGSTRSPGKMQTFQFIDKPSIIKRNNLYRVSNLKDEVIYMHDITE